MAILARNPAHQRRNSRILSEPCLFRRRHARRRGGGKTIFRQVRAQCDHRRGRPACRAAQGALEIRPDKATRAWPNSAPPLSIANMVDAERLLTSAQAMAAISDPAQVRNPSGITGYEYAADWVVEILPRSSGRRASFRRDRRNHHRSHVLQRETQRVVSQTLKAHWKARKCGSGRGIGSRCTHGGVKAIVGGQVLPREPVQPGHQVAAPAGIRVQAVRLSRCAGIRPDTGARSHQGRAASTSTAGDRRTTRTSIAVRSPCARGSRIR